MGADILPDETEVDLMALVKEYGWSLVDVYPDDEESENTPSFVFSVNLDEYCGWPELVFWFSQLRATGTVYLIPRSARMKRGAWRFDERPR